MKHSILFALLCAGVVSTTAGAQSVDREKYPDYSSELKPDYSLLKNNQESPIYRTKGVADYPLPDHVDNSRYKFFPPVFNQDGGSCGSASRICYMFTHEINSFRNVDGGLLSNQYPSHFVWLLTFGNSGKEDFAIRVGIPSAEVYGGRTYSKYFGNQDASQSDFGWMQGYDKWYAGMWNRMESTANFPLNVGTKEGREAVKRWLYNHTGDYDFQSGGIVGIGVASGGDWQPIPASPTNIEIGLAGKKYVAGWGKQTDHALTVVGYDDRVEFDLNGNKIYGEESADEKGAWIVVNSWGAGWCNNGFIYCPYAMAGPMSQVVDANKHIYKLTSGYWMPEIYKVRKNYRPLRTIKIKMDYSRRSELYLSAGVSSNLEATMPEQSIPFNHFKYAGDGENGRTNPAPEVPMLGRWADGKLHTEPMEFGYDLTDLSAKFDKNMPLKYFFIVETRDWAAGKGKIYNASIIDYEFQKQGVETPFDINAEGVEIKNQGNKTIISTIVYGETYYAPQNLALTENKLSWDAPLRSSHELKSYKIYSNGNLLAEVPTSQKEYTIADMPENATFSLSAVYTDNTESTQLSVNTPIVVKSINRALNFKHAGMSIPNVFASKHNELTMEYWIKANSLQNYNQQAGPGWGTFLLHSNNDGSFTVGWDTQNRTSVPGALRVNTWKHVAFTVNNNVMKVYVNGKLCSEFTSDSYSGIGGFGNLKFVADGANSLDARIDEMRIWNYAKSDEEIKNNYRVQYSGSLLPSSLLAYYKGDTLHIDNKPYFRDYAKGNHAAIINSKNIAQVIENSLKFQEPADGFDFNIVPPTTTVYQGLPAKFNTTHTAAVTKLEWTAEDAGIKNLQIAAPTLTFKTAGDQTVKVVATDENGKTIEKSCIVKVEATPVADASFTATKTTFPAGENVAFVSNKPMLGYLYEWSMPGSSVEKSNFVNATASYSIKGEYTVTLKVTGPDGKSSTTSQKVNVVEVAPVADFDVTPSVIVKGETTFLKDKSKFGPDKWQWLLHNPCKEIVVNGQNTSLTMNVPGIYDVTLNAQNGTGSNTITKKRALIVCNGDSENGLNFNRGHVELTQDPFEGQNRYVSMDWWMNPRTLVDFGNGIGEENKFEIKTTGVGSMFVVNGTENVQSHDNYVISGEWHHYALVFSSGMVSFYRDGELFGTATFKRGKKLPAFSKFSIGLENAPFDGQIDEFRIWKKKLDLNRIKKYAEGPITDVQQAVKDDMLSVYYNFNQSGGDLKDLTGHGIDGIRKGFGPDGDAWGLSRGVWALNFGQPAMREEISATYLKNYEAPFKTDGDKVVNPVGGSRFAAIADWTLENAAVQGDITTSVHVDMNKAHRFTFTSGWDGFGSLNNHKVYQTVTLPAGCYEFIANYGSSENNCGNSYLVAAKGKGLPDNLNLNEAISSVAMLPGNIVDSNKMIFVLSEETEISLGLVINLDGQSCCTINDFQLMRIDAEEVKANGANGYDLTVGAEGYSTLFLPYPTTVPENATAYVAKKIEGDEVVLEPLASGIVPANTGVVIAAQPGEYHFAPSLTSVAGSSILTGVLEDTSIDDNKRYFEIGAKSEPGFYLYNASSLVANHAYLVTESTDTHESYKLNLSPVGIDQIEAEVTNNAKVYDLSGRRVSEPTKGLYLINGKKVLVK